MKHLHHSTGDSSCGIPVLELDTQGCIRACTSSAAHLFGYEDEAALLGRSISHLLPQLEHAPLMHQGKVSGRLKLLSRCGVPFRARRHNGEHFDADLCINEFDDPVEKRVVLTVRRYPD